MWQQQLERGEIGDSDDSSDFEEIKTEGQVQIRKYSASSSSSVDFTECGESNAYSSNDIDRDEHHHLCETDLSQGPIEIVVQSNKDQSSNPVIYNTRSESPPVVTNGPKTDSILADTKKSETNHQGRRMSPSKQHSLQSPIFIPHRLYTEEVPFDANSLFKGRKPYQRQGDKLSEKIPLMSVDPE